MITQSEQLNTVSEVIVNDFTKPVLPEIKALAKALQEALQQFDRCLELNVKGTFFEHQVNSLLEQGLQFRQLTLEHGQDSSKMGTYTADLMEYINILIDGDVAGEDFIEAMRSLAEGAVENKICASTAKTGYCNILVEMKNISSQVTEFTVDLGDQKEAERALEEDVQELRRSQAAQTWAAVGTGIGTGLAIAAAPFTGGASLAVVGVLGVSSAGAMVGTTIGSVVNGEKAKMSEDELKRLRVNRINAYIDYISEQLKVITVEMDRLEQFWVVQVNELTRIIEKYHITASTTMFKVSRMKGVMMMKQWTGIKDEFDAFKKTIFKEKF